MNRKIFCLALCALLFLLCVSAHAQQQKKFVRIGFLTVRAGVEAREEVFRQGLQELGYVEGRNIAIEWRFAKGKADRLADLAAQLVRDKLDLIVTAGTEATQAAKNA